MSDLNIKLGSDSPNSILFGDDTNDAVQAFTAFSTTPIINDNNNVSTLNTDDDYENKMEVAADIIKIQPLMIQVVADNDTYAFEGEPYYNYYEMATIKTGRFNNLGYEGFVAFHSLVDEAKKIANYIVKGTLELTPIEPYSGKINIYRLRSRFDEIDITWNGRPRKEKLLGSIICDNNEKIEIDLGDFVRNVATKKIINTGLYIQAEPFLNVFSTNTNLFSAKPKLNIQYFDPNLTTTKKTIVSQITLKPVKDIPTSILLKLPFPILDTSVILSKPNIPSSIEIKHASYLDTEISYRFEAHEGIQSSILLSKNYVDSEIKLGRTLELDSEILFLSTDNIEELLSDISIKNIKVLLSKLNLEINRYIDSEIPLKFIDNEKELESFITLSRSSIPSNIHMKYVNVLDSEILLKKRYYNELDSEIPLKITNNEKYLDSVINLGLPGKDELETEIELKPIKILDSEILLKITNNEKYLDSVINLGLPGKDELETEVELSYVKVLDTEIQLKITNNEKYLESVINLGFPGKDELETEIELKPIVSLDSEIPLKFINNSNDVDSVINLGFPGKDELETELNILFAKSLRSMLYLKLNGEQSLDSELTLSTNEKYLNTCLYLSSDRILPSSINLVFNVNETLDTELRLKPVKVLDSSIEVVTRENEKIPTSLLLKNRSKYELESSLNLLFEKSLDTTMRFQFPDGIDKLSTDINLKFTNNEQSLDSELILIVNEKILNSEINIIPIMTKELDTELLLKNNGKHELNSSLNLLFEKSLDTVIRFQFPDGIDKLSTDINLKFNNNEQLLDSELILCTTEKRLDSEIILKKNDNKYALNSELILDLNSKNLDTIIPLKIINKENSLETEINLNLFKSKELNTSLTLLFEKSLDTSLELKESYHDDLDSEINIKNVEVLPSVIYLTKDYIDNSITIKHVDILDTSLDLKERYHDDLDSEVILDSKRLAKLTSSISVLFSNVLDTQMPFKFPDGIDKLSTDITIKKVAILDSEIQLEEYEDSMRVYYYTT